MRARFTRLIFGLILLGLASPALAQVANNTNPLYPEGFSVQTGSAAASVTNTISGTASKYTYLFQFTVTCGVASGATIDSTITITGLLGGTLTYPFRQSQTGVFQLTDWFAPAQAATASGNVVISVPAMTNGGACYTYAGYVQQ